MTLILIGIILILISLLLMTTTDEVNSPALIVFLFGVCVAVFGSFDFLENRLQYGNELQRKIYAERDSISPEDKKQLIEKYKDKRLWNYAERDSKGDVIKRYYTYKEAQDIRNELDVQSKLYLEVEPLVEGK